MKKYLIFRTPRNVDRDIRQHELIGVEHGEDIHSVTDTIIRTVSEDLAENPKYTGCFTTAHPPESTVNIYDTTRYAYYVTGVVEPPNAPKNICVEYGIVEQESDSVANTDHSSNRTEKKHAPSHPLS